MKKRTRGNRNRITGLEKTILAPPEQSGLETSESLKNQPEDTKPNRADETHVISDRDVEEMTVTGDTSILDIQDITDIPLPKTRGSQPEATGATSVEKVGPDTGERARFVETSSVAELLNTGSVQELQQLIAAAQMQLRKRVAKSPEIDNNLINAEKQRVSEGSFPFGALLSEVSQEADPKAFENTIKKAANMFRELGFDKFQEQFEKDNIVPSVINQILQNPELIKLTRGEAEELEKIRNRKRVR